MLACLQDPHNPTSTYSPTLNLEEIVAMSLGCAPRPIIIH